MNCESPRKMLVVRIRGLQAENPHRPATASLALAGSHSNLPFPSGSTEPDPTDLPAVTLPWQAWEDRMKYGLQP